MANPLVVPPGFPTPFIPSGNPITAAKVELGRYLFYSTELSSDGKHSCASCHNPSAWFCDPGNHWSFGVGGEHGERNTPALINLAWDTSFFWDGRTNSLEAQVLVPIYNPVEMGNDSGTIMAALSKDPLWSGLFNQAFGDTSITMTHITNAIASFERTLTSGWSAYDRFEQGDTSAISDAAKRGLVLFRSSANCSRCHTGFNFTDNGYHSTGLDFQYADAGRGYITGNPNEIGAFKTPTLRNVALTAPYMHDGRFNTLLQVVESYNIGGLHNPMQDSLVHPLHLSVEQMQDIVAFLHSLTDSSFISRKDFSNPYK